MPLQWLHDLLRHQMLPWLSPLLCGQSGVVVAALSTGDNWLSHLLVQRCICGDAGVCTRMQLASYWQQNRMTSYMQRLHGHARMLEHARGTRIQSGSWRRCESCPCNTACQRGNADLEPGEQVHMLHSHRCSCQVQQKTSFHASLTHYVLAVITVSHWDSLLYPAAMQLGSLQRSVAGRHVFSTAPAYKGSRGSFHHHRRTAVQVLCCSLAQKVCMRCSRTS